MFHFLPLFGICLSARLYVVQEMDKMRDDLTKSDNETTSRIARVEVENQTLQVIENPVCDAFGVVSAMKCIFGIFMYCEFVSRICVYVALVCFLIVDRMLLLRLNCPDSFRWVRVLR